MGQIHQLVTTDRIRRPALQHRRWLTPGNIINIGEQLDMMLRHNRIEDTTGELIGYETTLSIYAATRVIPVIPVAGVLNLEYLGRVIVLRAHRLDRHGRPETTLVEIHDTHAPARQVGQWWLR